MGNSFSKKSVRIIEIADDKNIEEKSSKSKKNIQEVNSTDKSSNVPIRRTIGKKKSQTVTDLEKKESNFNSPNNIKRLIVGLEKPKSSNYKDFLMTKKIEESIRKSQKASMSISMNHQYNNDDSIDINDDADTIKRSEAYHRNLESLAQSNYSNMMQQSITPSNRQSFNRNGDQNQLDIMEDDIIEHQSAMMQTNISKKNTSLKKFYNSKLAAENQSRRSKDSIMSHKTEKIVKSVKQVNQSGIYQRSEKKELNKSLFATRPSKFKEEQEQAKKKQRLNQTMNFSVIDPGFLARMRASQKKKINKINSSMSSIRAGVVTNQRAKPEEDLNTDNILGDIGEEEDQSISSTKNKKNKKDHNIDKKNTDIVQNQKKRPDKLKVSISPSQYDKKMKSSLEVSMKKRTQSGFNESSIRDAESNSSYSSSELSVEFKDDNKKVKKMGKSWKNRKTLDSNML